MCPSVALIITKLVTQISSKFYFFDVIHPDIFESLIKAFFLPFFHDLFSVLCWLRWYNVFVKILKKKKKNKKKKEKSLLLQIHICQTCPGLNFPQMEIFEIDFPIFNGFFSKFWNFSTFKFTIVP